MFTHGDIVKMKFGSVGVEYFIVTDAVDFSDKNDGSDMLYEIMRIFPVAKTSKMANVNENQIELQAKGNGKDGKMIMDWVMEQRTKNGWVEEPDFVAVIRHNQKMNKLKSVLPPNTDVINYDKLPDIDSCLDAMNDLKRLHEAFGDEAYLQLREVVVKRLQYFLD